MKKFLVLISMIISLQLYSQKILNEVLIKIDKRESITSVLNQENLRTEFKIKNLCEELGYYLLIYPNEIEQNTLLELENSRGIISASYNEFLQKRTIPNDSLYNKQWALPFTNIDKVWDVTTGGKTNSGKQIVIAVLDDGFDIDHKDLNSNIWRNENEIPNDNKDNDNNGYVDDYIGYNVDTGNGDFCIENHGTSVAGIIAATTNNKIGIAGINRNAKVLPICGVNKLDEIISAYYYVHKMRKLFNETDGSKGAFIPVTNYSGGIAKAMGNKPPYNAWCEMYDLLGSQGILSVGATDNSNVNVEIMGDMPSTCVSDFFVCVTNIDKTGTKVTQAGFSDKFIALGAPGEDIFTLKSQNKYDMEFSGTSAACPMVAGVMALLFSVPCNAFDSLIQADKMKAALAVKDAILNGVTPTLALRNQTQTGGYLNAESALGYLIGFCNGEIDSFSIKGKLDIVRIERSDFAYKVFYITPDDINYSYRVTNLMGGVIYESKLVVPILGEKTFTFSKDLNINGLAVLSIFNETDIVSKLIYFE